MDPNADTHGTGGRTGETKVNLLFHKSVIQQKKNKQTKGQETIISPKTKNQSSKENSTRMHEEKGRVPIKTKVQIKQMQNAKTQDPKNTCQRETRRTWTGTWIKAATDRDRQNTTTRQGVKETQTLMNRRGTGEERERREEAR